MHNNINFNEGFNQYSLLNGLLILGIIATLSLIYGFAYMQLKRRYKKRYDILLTTFEMEAKTFYKAMSKHNQSKAKLSDGFIFMLVDLAKLADQLHLVSENEQKRWRSSLNDAFNHMEEKITAIHEDGEQQNAQKQLLLQKIATLRELV